MSYHTPKPWTAMGSLIMQSGDPHQHVARVTHRLIDSERSPGPDHDECATRSVMEFDANRALIAAAPEMLAVLEELVEDIEGCLWRHVKMDELEADWPDIMVTYKHAQKVLAKVRSF